MNKIVMTGVAACILAAAQPAFAEEPSGINTIVACPAAQSVTQLAGSQSLGLHYMIVTKEEEGRPTDAEWKRIHELAETALSQVLSQVGPTCSPERTAIINHLIFQTFVDFMGAELPRMKVVNFN